MTQHDIALGLGIFSVACTCAVLAIRIPEARARFRAWRNRWKHPKLAREYRRADVFDRCMIAQDMLCIDREMLRMHGVSSDSPLYPDVWDYHIPPGRIGWFLVRERRADSRAELTEMKARRAC